MGVGTGMYGGSSPYSVRDRVRHPVVSDDLLVSVTNTKRRFVHSTVHSRRSESRSTSVREERRGLLGFTVGSLPRV